MSNFIWVCVFERTLVRLFSQHFLRNIDEHSHSDRFTQISANFDILNKNIYTYIEYGRNVVSTLNWRRSTEIICMQTIWIQFDLAFGKKAQIASPHFNFIFGFGYGLCIMIFREREKKYINRNKKEFFVIIFIRVLLRKLWY